MDNQLREFEKLLLDNAFFKVHNQALVDKNPKWKKWRQTKEQITKEQIQNSLELVYMDEEAYLNELVAYKLKFQGSTYDQLNAKLVEVHVETSKRF